MDKLDKILISSLAKRGLSKTVTGPMVCFYAEEWGMGRFSVISFSEGVLKVSVKSSSAASELHIQEAELVFHLNKKLKKTLVKKVRIVVLCS